MCRNIKPLFNFDPPVTDEEIRAASLQFVRKITGFNKPSRANEAAFESAIEEISGICARLLIRWKQRPLPETGKRKRPRPGLAQQNDSEPDPAPRTFVT